MLTFSKIYVYLDIILYIFDRISLLPIGLRISNCDDKIFLYIFVVDMINSANFKSKLYLAKLILIHPLPWLFLRLQINYINQL